MMQRHPGPSPGTHDWEAMAEQCEVEYKKRELERVPGSDDE